MLELNKKGQWLLNSCEGRCEDETEPSKAYHRQCKCDPTCLFLGDCCYDYLLKCNPQKTTFDAALSEQSNSFRKYFGQSSCNGFYKMKYDDVDTDYIRLVDSCPNDITIHGALCRNDGNTTTIANFIPVVAQGVPFFNVYCAACHGMMLKDIYTLTAKPQVSCLKPKENLVYPSSLRHFYPKFSCNRTTIDLSARYIKVIGRSSDCVCGSDQPEDYCASGEYQNECFAYKAIGFQNTQMKNEACLACNQQANVNSTNITDEYCSHERAAAGPNWISINFFKFVKSNPSPDPCQTLHLRGQPGDICLIKKCQPGFRLHDGQCISINHSISCLQHYENFYNDEYNVVDLFRPALLVVIDHEGNGLVKDELVYRIRETILEVAGSCSEVQQKVYLDIFKETGLGNIRCYLIYSTAWSYSSIVQAMESGEIERYMFPGSRLVKIAAVNHDPVVGINCSGGTDSYIVTHKVKSTIPKILFRSRVSDRLVISNQDPMVAIKDVLNQKTTYHALFCKLRSGKDGCGLNGTRRYSIYENCPKYELETLPNSWVESMTLTGGVRLTNEDYLYSEKGNVLVCSEVYDQKYADEFSERMAIAVSTCYSVSLLCLLATFLIYVRYPPLRTLPGLMLMNLIVALFLAQLMYLMNTFKLFAIDKTFCKFMASAQHFFWLSSFAWMLCLSLDIFRCFSVSCSTVKTYMRTTYYKYMSAGWLVPIPVPLVAMIMDYMDIASIGYDSTTCWLWGTNSVLYLFALPVLSIVTINIILFVGSVYRLSVLMRNAAFVGRKEDNKQRLIQCIKLSSWMGISWLFGIIPNILDLKALWYVFAVANAFQGVHIFFAFGVTGRARLLMKEEKIKHSSIELSTTMPTVSGTLPLDVD